MPLDVAKDILLVAGDTAIVRLVLETLAARGIRGVIASDLPEAAQKLAVREWPLVLIEQPQAAQPLFDLLRIARQNTPELPIVLIGDNSSSSAVRAIREGCCDYLPRPLERQALEAALDAHVSNHQVPLAAVDGDDGQHAFCLAGGSRPFLEMLHVAAKVAPTSVPVLITGESGTGKELISYLLHRKSQRRHGPYVRVNCAALSETLLESELFGHERGAFTGAVAQRKGRFERAHGGTLLLDEISETTPRLQAELLRVLEQQDFERVGGTESIRVNVRVISTSNRDLARDVEQGRFRKDLYYRLAGVHLVAPPLRHRRQDILPLTWHFVNLHAGEVRRSIRQIDPETLVLFDRYPWPGNIRQLRSVVRTALILGEGPKLSLSCAPQLRNELAAGADAAATAESAMNEAGVGRIASAAQAATPQSVLSLHELERQAVFEALRRTQKNQVKAARLLGITDRTLREKLRRYRTQEALQTTGGLA